MSRRRLAALVVLPLAVAACGDDGSGATADEAAVCDATQEIVDAVVDGESADAQERAVSGLAALLDATAETGNAVLAGAGDDLREVTTGQIDPGGFTYDQTIEFGRVLGVAGAAALDEIIIECDAVGAPVERLDQVPTDALDAQIVEEYRGVPPVPPSTTVPPGAAPAGPPAPSVPADG